MAWVLSCPNCREIQIFFEVRFPCRSALAKILSNLKMMKNIGMKLKNEIFTFFQEFNDLFK